MFIPFTGWMPDADPTTAGALVDDSNNIVPTLRGYRGASDWAQVVGQTTVSATAVGLWYAARTDGNGLLFVGTADNIYLRAGGAWTANTSVTVSAVDRWQFAQWGDLTFAGAKATQPLVTDTTTFTSIAAMPRYACIDSVNEFVMIANVATSVTYSDGNGSVAVLPGDHPDRWWCSAIGNPLAYAPSIATQAATGRLTDMPGPITCLRAIGDRVVVYKDRGAYIGTYVGPTNGIIWQWELLSQEVGTWGQNCVVPVNFSHFFLGNDNFYQCDGQQMKPIGNGMREWFFRRAQKAYLQYVIGVYDQINDLVFWWYPGAGSSGGALTEFVCYHTKSGRWGCGSNPIQAASSFYVDAVTWDQLWAGYSFDTIPNTSWDDAVRSTKSFIPVFVNQLRRLVTLLGPQLNSRLKTSWAGDDDRASLLRRVRPRWIDEPDIGTCIPYRRMRQAGTISWGPDAYASTNGQWHFTSHARWHALQFNFNGDWEATGIAADVVSRGRE